MISGSDESVLVLSAGGALFGLTLLFDLWCARPKAPFWARRYGLVGYRRWHSLPPRFHRPGAWADLLRSAADSGPREPQTPAQEALVQGPPFAGLPTRLWVRPEPLGPEAVLPARQPLLLRSEALVPWSVLPWAALGGFVSVTLWAPAFLVTALLGLAAGWAWVRALDRRLAVFEGL